ncbi:hypothetical protein [Rhizobium tubonense]|uniref:hypothetical protein n=1 Tax=Rhizobium tubonense TaxID=484088 RepID=UPI001FCE4BBE|nr:hypothetical protein [Rhizobium tubonense]
MKNDFSDMIRVPAVDNPDKIFLLTWNADTNSYSIMSFTDTFAAAIDVTGLMPKSVYDPANHNADAFARANHTGVQAISTVTGLQTALDSKDGKVVYAAKSANYTALLADNNAVHRFTAAATVALTAAATLGANWHYTVVANGADVTIDPNSTETINGLLTLIVPNGTSAQIICDGSAFFTVFKPTGWQLIERRSFSGVNAVTFLNLFGDIRLRGFVDSAGAGADLYWRSSTNNGSSYDTGASDYTFEALLASSTSITAARTTGSLASITTGGFSAGVFDMTITGFGRALPAAAITAVSGASAGGTLSGASLQFFSQWRNSSVARNAIQIGTTPTSNISGFITVEALA